MSVLLNKLVYTLQSDFVYLHLYMTRRKLALCGYKSMKASLEAAHHSDTDSRDITNKNEHFREQ